MSNLTPGLHCIACDRPLSHVDDNELCGDCMAVVYMYNRKLLEEVEEAEVMDMELLIEDLEDYN